MPVQPTPRQNHLLAALPDADYERLLPSLELVPMRLGEVLYTSGSELPYLYFPTTCIVSLVYVMANGASAEIAVTGHEGLLGVSMGETTLDNRVTLEAVYCLGLCHSSPAAMLDKRVHGILDETSLDALVKEAQA